MHPFRFGVTIRRAASADQWVASARRAEELGYDILLMPDHLGSQLSPIAALMAAAAATTRLRVGTYVLAIDLRDPLMLAREAATLDLLSGGRFELGLGAGWSVADYHMIGRPYDPPPRRIDRLAEAAPLVKRLLAGETVDHDGPNYPVAAPAWCQRSTRALLIGGGGPRMLRLAAREADIVAIQQQFDPRGRPMPGETIEDALERKVAIVREAAGPLLEGLELNMITLDAGLVGSGRTGLDSLQSATKALVRAGKPYFLYGTLGQVRDLLLRRRDRLGISYYTIPGHAMEAMASLVAALAGR
jgi:probable F420-dependent oxidoreductase